MCALQAQSATCPGANRGFGETQNIFAMVYRELHRLAGRLLRRHGVDLTLDPTAVLHETYLDLAPRNLRFATRAQFFAYAGRAMRAIIIDHVRHRNALKRGAGLVVTSLEDAPDAGDSVPACNLGATRLNEAIQELMARDSSLAELVELKFFCGLSFGEIATLRAISERTVQRDWKKARQFLFETLRED
jgi:RNA polymerase sigma factor (TIGR02999 family)